MNFASDSSDHYEWRWRRQVKGKELGQLILEGLLIAEDGRLVVHDSVHDGVHVGAEGLYILVDEDLVLLGLILVCIKMSSEVMHLVL